jgi:hypothetical protein
MIRRCESSSTDKSAAAGLPLVADVHGAVVIVLALGSLVAMLRSNSFSTSSTSERPKKRLSSSDVRG